MAPAAYDTISTYLNDTGDTPQDYDLILRVVSSLLLKEKENKDA